MILGVAVGATIVGTVMTHRADGHSGTLTASVQTATAIIPALSGGLVLPINCEVGVSCEVQNYVDRDDSSGASDFRCGSRSYDKHNGVDFRLRDMAAQRRGVNVLAAAAGLVVRTRADIPDVSVTAAGVSSVAGRECGNGVVVEHGDSLTTQYCHLAKTSLRVKPGDRVRPGDVLGQVGLSGLTEYPHLHFTVRRGGTVIDPFLVSSPSCTTGPSLWTAGAAVELGYRQRAVLNTGFSSSPVTMESIEAGNVPAAAPDRPAFVAFVRVIGVRRADIQTLTISGPDGAMFAETISEPISRDQAQRLLYVGARRSNGWSRGRYVATYRVMSGEMVLLEKQFEVAF